MFIYSHTLTSRQRVHVLLKSSHFIRWHFISVVLEYNVTLDQVEYWFALSCSILNHMPKLTCLQTDFINVTTIFDLSCQIWSSYWETNSLTYIFFSVMPLQGWYFTDGSNQSNCLLLILNMKNGAYQDEYLCSFS